MDELLELTRENNKILRSMRRSARVGGIFRTLYWTILLGSLFGTYYYIQPYINQLSDVFGQALATFQDIKNKADNIPDPSNLNLPPELLRQLDSAVKNQ